MAVATITMEDTDSGKVAVTLEFDPAIGAGDCAPPSARLAMEMMEWLAHRDETRPASPDLADKFRAVEGQL